MEQVARLIDEHISAEKIHGMLRLKQAQIEQNLRDDLQRVRSIEERLYEIETEGVLSDEMVLVKSIPEQRFLSIRQTVPNSEGGFCPHAGNLSTAATTRRT